MEYTRLLQEIREGREEALKFYYEKYRSIFLNWGKKHFNCDIPTLLDVYQDSWIIFYRKIITGELKQIDNSLENYIIGIGWRLLLRHKFKTKDTQFIDDFSALIELEDEPHLTAIITNELDNDIKKQLRDAIAKLSPTCSRLLTLFYFEGYDIEEITEIMNYPNKNTTSASKARCLIALKDLINKPFI